MFQSQDVLNAGLPNFTTLVLRDANTAQLRPLFFIKEFAVLAHLIHTTMLLHRSVLPATTGIFIIRLLGNANAQLVSHINRMDSVSSA